MLYLVDASIDWDGALAADPQALIGAHPEKVFYEMRALRLWRMSSSLVSAIAEYRDAPSCIDCRDLVDVRRWLAAQRYVSDRAQFGDDDVWMHPSDFERTGMGDCDDHALWAYARLAQLGYDARFTVGTWHRRGHAWVMLRFASGWWLLETTDKDPPTHVARIERARGYRPSWSVDRRLAYYDHRVLAPTQVGQCVSGTSSTSYE